VEEIEACPRTPRHGGKVPGRNPYAPVVRDRRAGVRGIMSGGSPSSSIAPCAGTARIAFGAAAVGRTGTRI
jgi:hypothetical protein